MGLSVVYWLEGLGGGLLGLRLAYIPNLRPLVYLKPFEKFLVVVVLGVESKFSVQLRPKLNNRDAFA